jgi:hypothetical protein
MRGWFHSLGVGTKRNNRPLPKRLLLAPSGHGQRQLTRPLLGVKQTFLATVQLMPVYELVSASRRHSHRHDWHEGWQERRQG